MCDNLAKVTCGGLEFVQFSFRLSGAATLR